MWWVYFAPQNIPRAIALTLGSKVVLCCIVTTLQRQSQRYDDKILFPRHLRTWSPTSSPNRDQGTVNNDLTLAGLTNSSTPLSSSCHVTGSRIPRMQKLTVPIEPHPKSPLRSRLAYSISAFSAAQSCHAGFWLPDWSICPSASPRDQTRTVPWTHHQANSILFANTSPG